MKILLQKEDTIFFNIYIDKAYFFFNFNYLISIAFLVHFVKKLQEENINCTLGLWNECFNILRDFQGGGGYMFN